MAWDVAKTRSLIEVTFGRDQLDLARPCLKSVIDRQEFARYHYQEAIGLVERFAEKYLTDKPLIAVLLDNGNDRWVFEELMVKISAHSIACIQCIHSVPDILAHALFYSLGLNRGKVVKEREIYAEFVRKLLESDSRFKELGFALKKLTTEGAFDHLAALANHSKHRSIVQPQLNEDMTGLRADRHEVRFSSFTYEGRQFPEISIKTLLEPEYAKSSRITVDVGEKLNRLLSAGAIQSRCEGR